jgi:hypothetical protein
MLAHGHPVDGKGLAFRYLRDALRLAVYHIYRNLGLKGPYQQLTHNIVHSFGRYPNNPG